MSTACSALIASWLLMGWGMAQPRGAAPGPSNQVDYALVVTGEELLRGVYPDAHTAFITRTLHPLGCHCVGSMTVDDKPEDVKSALAFWTKQAPLVIVTGGLGPTLNDITRGALADYTGLKLREDPEVIAELERRFSQPRDQLRPNLRRQALVPERGGFLRNPNGTAVGLIYETGASVIVALPGPPRELQPMVRNELVPYLRKKFGVRTVGCALTLRFVGIGQSQIDQAIRDHVPLPPGMTVGSLFEGSRVDFMFFLPGDTVEERAQLQQVSAKIHEHLSEFLYAEDESSLEEVVARRVLARGGPLVLVEIGSGGHLAASLDAVKDVERVVAGAYMAPSEESMRRLLDIPEAQWPDAGQDEARLKALAAAAQKLSHANGAVVVGEVQSDGAGRSGVWVGLVLADRLWERQRLTLQGAGEIAHANLATQILDRLRRQLGR